ncbi:uncharacterized protein E0L32_006791 [Thyridium curvatum]|uniref:Uncharacterized protein n=1 Tax=Thyridium curvatum TaxID=1093900 RepID=A0A507B772_9PEZI|nr:uncharacterized protein E0L32_006791 [Thyridium curvatum]TPX12911.1 hypothetical protein E0L32_006791 [Thyridium curvatum]
MLHPQRVEPGLARQVPLVVIPRLEIAPRRPQVVRARLPQRPRPIQPDAQPPALLVPHLVAPDPARRLHPPQLRDLLPAATPVPLHADAHRAVRSEADQAHRQRPIAGVHVYLPHHRAAGAVVRPRHRQRRAEPVDRRAGAPAPAAAGEDLAQLRPAVLAVPRRDAARALGPARRGR